MNSITELHVSGFRRLADVKIAMRPLCVAIGANGSGKTSLLDVISLLAASARGSLSATVRDFGGMGAIESQLSSRKEPGFSIEVTSRLTEQHSLFDSALGFEGTFEYTLGLRPLVLGAYFISESLQHTREASVQPAIELIEGGDIQGELDRTFNVFGETSLSQVDHNGIGRAAFRRHLTSVTHYRNLSVGTRALVRLPQALRPAQLPGSDGEDLISCLYTMRETTRDRFDDVESALQAAFPSFERLEFPPVAAGTVALTWKDSNCSRPLYMNQLSEGTLRFLWLVTLLQSPGLTELTLIDEPEVSLHPEMLRILAELLREASARTQIIVATHSDSLVRFLKPEEVLTFDIGEDGTAQAQWADEQDLKHWLEDYTLDELWRMGRIGGRA